MVFRPGKDINDAILEEGYIKLANDPEYKKQQDQKRRFTQADLDKAYGRGYDSGYDQGWNEGFQSGQEHEYDRTGLD